MHVVHKGVSLLRQFDASNEHCERNIQHINPKNSEKLVNVSRNISDVLLTSNVLHDLKKNLPKRWKRSKFLQIEATEVFHITWEKTQLEIKNFLQQFVIL